MAVFSRRESPTQEEVDAFHDNESRIAIQCLTVLAAACFIYAAVYAIIILLS